MIFPCAVFLSHTVYEPFFFFSLTHGNLINRSLNFSLLSAYLLGKKTFLKLFLVSILNKHWTLHYLL